MDLAGRFSMVASIAVMAVAVHLVARIWHPQRLFLFDVGRDLTDRDRARVWRVMIVNAVVSLACIAVALLAEHETLLIVATTVGPFVPITWLLVEFALAVRTIQRDMKSVPFSVPLGDRPPLRSYLSAPMQVANAAAVVLPTGVFVWILGTLPDRIPVHYGASGQPDRYGSPHELWFFLAIILFDYVLMWLILWGVSRERWALPKQDPERYGMLQWKRRALVVRMCEAIFLGIDASMALMWVSAALGSLEEYRWLVGTGITASVVLMCAGIVVPLVVYLAPLVKVQAEMKEIAGTNVLGTKESAWRWGGMVYYAPDDPALFVPKKLGIGQTFNFARPAAWIILVTILVLPILLSVGVVVFINVLE